MFDEFKKHIKNVNSDDIENYDSVEPVSNFDMLRGMRKKVFVRCNSEVFENLINELTSNPDCSYETYMNQLIKEGYVPKYLSVLLKDSNHNMVDYDSTGLGHFRDVCASRILNFFECPTVYESIIYLDGKLKVCSVDFGKTDEDFYNLEGLIDIGDRDDVIGNIANLEMLIQRLNKKYNFVNVETYKQKFLDDYIYSFLVRRYVLADGDCWFNNFGIIIDTKEKSFKFAPNFDFEYCFDYASAIKPYRKIYSYNLNFIKREFPKVYEKFSRRFEEFMSKKDGNYTYVNLIQKEIGDGEKSKDFIDKYGKSLVDLQWTFIREQERTN